MKTFCCAIALSALPFLAGCGSGGGAGDLDPDALQAVFQEETVPAEDVHESTTDSLTIPGGAAGGVVQVKEVANQAALAIRKDELAEAMVLLQTLRRAQNLTPNQLTAVQDQMAALQSDLASRAANGDARAQKALDLIGQSTRW